MTINNLSKSPNFDDPSSGRSENNSPQARLGNSMGNGGGTGGNHGTGIGSGNTLLPPYNGNMKMADVPNFNVIPPLPSIYYAHPGQGNVQLSPMPGQGSVQLSPLPRQGQIQSGGGLPMPQGMHHQQQLLQPQHVAPLPHVQYEIQPHIPPPHIDSHSHLHPVSIQVPESHLQLQGSMSQDSNLHPDSYFPNKKKIKKNSRRKHRNSHLGCGTCKKRRIKCDETLPACHNCLKGKLHCAYLNLDSNAQAALRMAQYNQSLRQEKIENSVQSNDKSTTTSPKPNSPNPIPSPKQIYPSQTYQIPQIIPPQPMLSGIPMNQQIPVPIPISHPINQVQPQQQPNGMIYIPSHQNVQQFPPLQHSINHDKQNHDQDVKLPPIKKLTHDLDKVPKISNLLL